jgi:hypothetical protein
MTSPLYMGMPCEAVVARANVRKTKWKPGRDTDHEPLPGAHVETAIDALDVLQAYRHFDSKRPRRLAGAAVLTEAKVALRLSLYRFQLREGSPLTSRQGLFTHRCLPPRRIRRCATAEHPLRELP